MPPRAPHHEHHKHREHIAGAAVVVVVAWAALFFALPLVGLGARVPWTRAPSLLLSPVFLEALGLSVGVALGALGLAVVVGVPVAAVLARGTLPGRGLLRALVSLPLVLPPVVAGIGLLLAFGRRGPLGGLWELPFTTAGAVVAATFVSAPFFILSVEAGFARVDPLLVDAARALGAGRWLLWRAVWLPALRPSLVTGASLCFARALGEFGATITFAGNLQGRTQTMPLLVYGLMADDPGAAALAAVVLLGVAVVVVVGLRAWGRDP